MANTPENPNLDSEKTNPNEAQREDLVGANLKRSTISASIPNYETYQERTLEQEEKRDLLQKVDRLANGLENLLVLNEGDKVKWILEIKPKMSERQMSLELDLFLKQNDIEALRFVGEKYAPDIDRRLVENLSAEEIENFKEKCREIIEKFGARSPERVEPMNELKKQTVEKLLKRTQSDFKRASANVTVKVISNENVTRASLDNITVVTDEENVFLKYENAMSLEDATAYIAQRLNSNLKT
jgi:hypothetical protein